VLDEHRKMQKSSPQPLFEALPTPKQPFLNIFYLGSNNPSQIPHKQKKNGSGTIWRDCSLYSVQIKRFIHNDLDLVKTEE